MLSLYTDAAFLVCGNMIGFSRGCVGGHLLAQPAVENNALHALVMEGPYQPVYVLLHPKKLLCQVERPDYVAVVIEVVVSDVNDTDVGLIRPSQQFRNNADIDMLHECCHHRIAGPCSAGVVPGAWQEVVS